MTDNCEFDELLFLWQANPELLGPGQWTRLEQHLMHEPPCSACERQLNINNEVLEKLKHVQDSKPDPITLPLAATARALDEGVRRDRPLVATVTVDGVQYDVEEDPDEYLLFLTGDVPSDCRAISFGPQHAYSLEERHVSEREIVGLFWPELDEFIELGLPVRFVRAP